MVTYFNLYCLVVLCGRLLKSHSQYISGNPVFYKTKTGQLRCNCKPNRGCGNNGTCSPDICAVPYMGRNCQHATVEMIPITSKPLPPPQLVDTDERTCVSWAPGKVFRYEFHHSINFIWLYMSWKSTYHMKPQLALYNNNKIQSIDQYFLKISDKSILIRLRNNVFYKKLELSDLPSDLCSVEVSIGRNLAISSTADQSSVYWKVQSTPKQNAQRAISGSDNKFYEDKRWTDCTHTAFPRKQRNEWWQTVLKYDALVNSVFILNRDQEACRLSYFFVETFDSSSNLVYRHKNANQAPYYSFSVASEKLVKRVKLTLDMSKGSGCGHYGVLTICEIYIYGEFRCPVNKYGPLCDIDCPKGCTREKCDPDWGCPDGCNGKWEGIWCDKDCNLKWNLPNCDKNCSTTCASKLKVGRGECNLTTGHCLYGCVPGYNFSSSPFCMIKCQFPHFGQNCMQRCDNCMLNKKLNVRRCHHVTGKCMDGCAPGFAGPDCIKMGGRRLMYLLIFLFIVFALHVYGWIKQARRNYKKRNTIFCCWNK